MKKTFLLFLTVFLFSQYAFSQTTCACCTESYKQFDFWIGEWNVYDTAGNKIGENLITKLENDCLISEHWTSVTGNTGRSFNYFDNNDSTWNQTWVDNQGTNLVLKGKAAPGKMILKSALQKGNSIDWYANKITWTRNADNSVTQVWEIVDKNDKTLSIAFKGNYKRK
jgi:hypothetical protein